MAYGKFGFPSMAQKAVNGNNSSGKSPTKDSFIVRVGDIILNENHFAYRGPNSIGQISGFKINPNGDPSTTRIDAKPAFVGNNSFPLINEYVKVWKTVSPNSNAPQYVYEGPIALYGITAPNSNIFPSATSKITTSVPTTDYTQVGLGAVNVVTNEQPDVPVNSIYNLSQNTFVEKSDIHPLRPFMGDKIYEGRFGNSIRFGSTAKIPDTSLSNTWSDSGNNGDPIVIIRNGQPSNASSYGAEFIVENIRNDLSSVYLTSTQRLKDFKVASEVYNSYTTPPIAPSLFTQPQIALNSNRIVINAKTDSILLSSQKSVGISTKGSTNIDTNSLYISSNDIKLGSKNATEPVLKGDTTVELLKQLTKAIKDLATILEVEKNWPGGNLQTGYNPIAGNVLIVLEDIVSQLNNDSLKSQTTKVQ